MYHLLYILFSLFDSTTIQLDNRATLVLAEPMDWSIGDEIEIHLNPSWFSSHLYLAVNNTDSSSCAVTIPRQKSFTKQAYLWELGGVMRVREVNNDIMRTGSYWGVQSIPMDWDASDGLLVGYSGSKTYPHILINLAKTGYVQVHFIRYFNLYDDC